MDVHPLAARAFGARAEDYDRARPGWPPDAVAAVLERFGSGAVVDLAAGTGKLTRVIAEQAGTVIAVEPVDGMRRVLREQLPHIRTMSGTAEAIPLPTDSVDAVFVGEAFHWFDAERACAEIARVLKPSGGLAILFHELADKGPDWFRELSKIVVERRIDDPSRPAHGAWRAKLDAAPEFEPPRVEEFPYEHASRRELIVAEIGSFSSIGALPPDRLAEVLAACDAVLDRNGIDEFTFRYTVKVTTAQLKRSGSNGPSSTSGGSPQ
jgi:ubiquinone/menaquinone biosynthesis C-methylase UbiE